MKIECHDMIIEKLLDGSDLFNIPKFQRPYSWESDQLDDFWSDITKNAGDEYFIGSMVMFKDGEYLSIIDGQQRLTTILIFLSAIRQVMIKFGRNTLSESLHENYIEKKDKNGAKRFKLKTETSCPYLQQNIFSPEASKVKIKQTLSENKRLQFAFSFFNQKIIEETTKVENNSSPENRIKYIDNYLCSLRDKVLNLSIVFIKLQNQDDAFQVFETLNTRGKDLNVSDLVKNYLSSLLKVKNDDLNIVSSTWSEMEDSFTDCSENLKLDTFFLYYWLSFKGSAITKNSLFGDFKKSINKKSAESYLISIKKHADIYRFIHEPEYTPECLEKYNTSGPGFSEIKDAIKGIKVFRSTMQMPLVVALIDQYSENNINLSQLTKFLKKIENFHFVYTAVTGQRSKTGVSTLYSDTAKIIRGVVDKNDVQDIYNTFITDLREFYPDKDLYSIGFNEIEYSDTNKKKKHLIRYVLEKYMNNVVAGGQKQNCDNLTIEHLTSQDKKTSDGYKVGNLLFIDSKLNSDKLKNKSAFKKIAILKDNKNIWAQEDCLNNILKTKDWSSKDILDRTSKIADAMFDDILKF